MKNYKPIIKVLREYKEYLENEQSYDWKQRRYSRITGYVFGYIGAWNINSPLKDRFTVNDIGLIYGYIDRVYDKYIANK